MVGVQDCGVIVGQSSQVMVGVGQLVVTGSGVVHTNGGRHVVVGGVGQLPSIVII